MNILLNWINWILHIWNGFLKKCLQHPFAPTLLRRAAQGWASFHFDYWNTSPSKHRALNGVSVKHQFLPLYSRIWTKNGFPEEQSRGFLIYSLQDLQLPQTKLMFFSQQNIFQQDRLFNEYISTVMHIGGNCLWIYILRCCYDFSEMFTKKWQYDSFKTGSSYEYPRKLLLKIYFDVPLWL